MKSSEKALMRSRFLAIGLLLLSLGLALTSAVQKSPTMDEQNHIARGAAFLGTGDPRLSVEHPPVVNVLSALPAHLLLDLHLPLDEWWEAGEWYHFADSFMWRVNQHPDRIVFLARLPIMGIGLLLIALVFRWANSCFGPWGGLLAAAFCALDPNVLAHERLSTTEMGGTFFAFLAAYVFWRRLRQPSLVDTVLAGLALGLAFAAKLSALIFGPILALALLLDGALNKSERSRDLPRRIGILGSVAVLALLVVWSSYGFQTGPLPGVGNTVPASPYIRGVQAVLDFAGGGRPAYLLGEVSSEGWWYYFPVAFAVKTPLATLIGLVVATGLMASRPTRDDLFILIPPVVLLLISTTVRLNLGYRHLLPILPFLAVHIGRLAKRPVFKTKPVSMYFVIGLAAWLAISTLTIYPHFLAYFNAIGGGPERGWRILVDSNIDWGQDLKGLGIWMEQEDVERVKLSWFGSARPQAYGIPHDLLPGLPYGFSAWEDPPFNPEQPEPGVYAISVSNLVGVAFPDHDLYAWFRARQPSTKIGYSLFVYRVPGP
ncbi:MAG: glycosyltransferase family 39 protein [Anaerolineae bacterium]|jgi:4-amino-4-deoxy-L-arabinose transferase-like glycosyltransferase